MKYAVVLSGNKQVKVSEGDTITVESLNFKPNESFAFEKVLLLVDGDTRKIGKPYLEGVMVSAKVLEHLRGPKIRVARFKAKARYRKVIGFRPSQTKLQIEKISEKAKKEEKK